MLLLLKITARIYLLEYITWILTQILYCRWQEECVDYSWPAVLYKLYSEFFSKICPRSWNSRFVLTNMHGVWPRIGGEGPGVECQIYAQVNSTWIHDCAISVFQGGDAAFLAEYFYVGSRERAAILRRVCNNICLFRKHLVSVIQVYTYCIKCKTFYFACCRKSI